MLLLRSLSIPLLPLVCSFYFPLQNPITRHLACAEPRKSETQKAAGNWSDISDVDIIMFHLIPHDYRKRWWAQDLSLCWYSCQSCHHATQFGSDQAESSPVHHSTTRPRAEIVTRGNVLKHGRQLERRMRGKIKVEERKNRWREEVPRTVASQIKWTTFSFLKIIKLIN